MTLDIQARVAATRRRIIRIAVGIGVGVLALLVAIALVTRGGEDKSAKPGSPVPSTVPQAATAVGDVGADTTATQPPAGEGFVPPARRVVLPSSAEQVDEYPVRFPRTPEGAAAVAVAMTRYSATLDYTTADEVMRLYSDPSIADQVSKQAAAGVRGLRQEMDLPLADPVATENAVVARPIGVQWKRIAKDVYDVSVLFTLERISGGSRESELVRGTNRLRWLTSKGENGGDWKLVVTADPAAPKGGLLGSKAFNDGGYAAIAEERA